MRSELVSIARLLDELREDHARLAKNHEEIQNTALRIGALFESLSSSIKQAGAVARAPGASDPLAVATRRMTEMNQSFNMQYLRLQQKMQDESRRFTLLSNVMKTKHDTAKNSISNVR